MMEQSRRRKLKNIDNTGFGVNSNAAGSRLTNKDGSVNLKKTGLPFWHRISLYHTILRLPRWKFLLAVFLFYTIMNLIFASIYMLIGIENLQGIHAGNDVLNNFQQAYFFSSQTLTTVGYGHISPVGLSANIVASLESFMGILSFALVTGLLYGRFTRPKAYLKFGDKALIAPFNGMNALMIRLASYKNNHLTDVEALLTLAMHPTEDGRKVTRFYTLNLEIPKINSLALNWTIVHPINDESPLCNMSHEDMKAADVEILVFIKGFDDHFSSTVQQRTSYNVHEVQYGARFVPMYHRSDDGSTTILELDKIGTHTAVELAEMQTSSINA